MRLFQKYQTPQILLLLISFSLLLGSGPASAASAEMKSQGDTLSFELSGQNDWNYELKRISDKGQTKVVLMVKGLSADSFEKIKSTKNAFIQSVKVIPSGAGDKKQIEFVLANNKVETFDYLTDFPSKLIVDFYYNEPMPTAAEANVEKVERAPAQAVEVKSKKKASAKAVARKPANEFFSVADFSADGEEEGKQVDLKAGLFNNSNDSQFARFQISAGQINPKAANSADSFMGYPLIDQPYSFWTKMKTNFPDYEIQPENTDENKQIRLIKKLYDKKRSLVLRKTTDWFASKYPKSKYLEVAFGMTADVYAQEWFKNKKDEDFDYAQHFYSKLLERSTHSALFERTSLVIGFFDLEKKNYLSALRKFKAHSENEQFKSSSSKFYADLGMADCLAKLNKVNEATQIIESVEKNVEDPLIKAEASFRKADFLMAQEKYVDARNSYTETLKKYPQLSDSFPSAFFNNMEAQFYLKQYVESHATALEFIKRFPLHEQAPYALTRLGEVLESLGAPQEKAVGAYLETHFRYGDSPKTIVARLHLLSARMKGMKDYELNKTIEKMNDLAAKSELKNIEQFKTTMISDGFTRRKEFSKAIDGLVKYNQENPTIKNADPVVDRIKNNIYSYIQYLSENNQPREVLKVHHQYADNWIRKQERPDTFFYLGKAYQSAGAYEAALQKFKQAENAVVSPQRGIASVGTVETVMPKVEELRLAQADALIEQNDFQTAENVLESIKKPENLSQADQVARVNLAAKLYERKGDNTAAIRYLSEVIRVWKNEPDLVTGTAIKAAQLYAKTQKSQMALDVLDNMLQEKVSDKNKFLLQKAKGEIALEAKQWDAAISSLSYVIEQAPADEKTRLGEQKYKLGDLYFQKGEIKKAEDLWASLSDSNESMWNKLADEKMKSAKWKDEYKKYIKRIPAAVGVQ